MYYIIFKIIKKNLSKKNYSLAIVIIDNSGQFLNFISNLKMLYKDFICL